MESHAERQVESLDETPSLPSSFLVSRAGVGHVAVAVRTGAYSFRFAFRVQMKNCGPDHNFTEMT